MTKTDCAIIGIPGMQNYAVAVETSNILKYEAAFYFGEAGLKLFVTKCARSV